jgi:hypothetical protein
MEACATNGKRDACSIISWEIEEGARGYGLPLVGEHGAIDPRRYEMYISESLLLGPRRTGADRTSTRS